MMSWNLKAATTGTSCVVAKPSTLRTLSSVQRPAKKVTGLSAAARRCCMSAVTAADGAGSGIVTGPQGSDIDVATSMSSGSATPGRGGRHRHAPGTADQFRNTIDIVDFHRPFRQWAEKGTVIGLTPHALRWCRHRQTATSGPIRNADRGVRSSRPRVTKHRPARR